MTPELMKAPSSEPRPVVADPLGDELLEREIADFMTPGCVTVSGDASVADAAAALAAHRVHAVLVMGAADGNPLGWITARGLLTWIGRDTAMVRARDAISEELTAIDPHERVRVALYALSRAGTTHLLVRRRPHLMPEGVVSDYALAIAARR